MALSTNSGILNEDPAQKAVRLGDVADYVMIKKCGNCGYTNEQTAKSCIACGLSMVFEAIGARKEAILAKSRAIIE